LGRLSAFFLLTSAFKNGPFGQPEIFRRKVKLRFALIGQWNVGFEEKVEAREDAAL
jgi:hypothetical protein